MTDPNLNGDDFDCGELNQKDDEDGKVLLEKVKVLLDREVEIQKTEDGKYVVLYMSLVSPPPPKGDSKKEALEKFIKWYEEKGKTILPEYDDIEEDEFIREI